MSSSSATLDGKNRNPKVFETNRGRKDYETERQRELMEVDEAIEDEIDNVEGMN
jgi:hypothetical protein